MFKNKIAVKLSLYFAMALLLFAFLMGGVFMFLFRNHTLNLHKNQLSAKAESIASTLSAYMEQGHGQGMMGGYGAYLRFIGEIAGTDVWIVDEQLNLITSGMGQGMMGSRYVYSDLPQGAEHLIAQAFLDQTVFSEEFSGLLSQLTLTVGVPIKSGGGEIIGVVLLHSPVNGINEAIVEGGKLLLISLGIALILSVLLSIWLSKAFTDPIISKEAADALRLEQIRRDFVANISHELRTPVTVMRGSLEALVDHVVTEPEKVEEYHCQMLAEAKFLQRLVGDLLDLSRLQNADFVIEKTQISICDVIEDAVRSANHLAKQKGVTIHVQTDQTDCILQGDYGRLRQMLLIILDNAVKFSHQNGRVDVTLQGKQLIIRDYGAGIAPEHLPYIFERFYKSRSEQNKTGTGLGLAIAKQIAQRHQISLTAQSAEGEGAAFLFGLS